MNRPHLIRMSGEELMGRMLVFVRQYPKLSFSQWPPEHMAGYLNWLAGQDALRFTFAPGPTGPEITGLLLGWRTTEEILRHPEFLDAAYKFARPIPGGSVFWAEVLIGYPGALSVLVADHQWRHPDWRRLTYAARRRDRLVIYPDAEKLMSRLEKL